MENFNQEPVSVFDSIATNIEISVYFQFCHKKNVIHKSRPDTHTQARTHKRAKPRNMNFQSCKYCLCMKHIYKYKSNCFNYRIAIKISQITRLCLGCTHIWNKHNQSVSAYTLEGTEYRLEVSTQIRCKIAWNRILYMVVPSFWNLIFLFYRPMGPKDKKSIWNIKIYMFVKKNE